MGNKAFWYNSKTGMTYPTKVSEDCEHFDSVLEFKIYTSLRNYLPATAIKRQYPIVYKPTTLEYPELTWKVDFCIQFGKFEEDSIFLEAKGEWLLYNSAALAEFKHKMQFLEYVNHDYWLNLYLVSESGFKLDQSLTCLDIPTAITMVRQRIL